MADRNGGGFMAAALIGALAGAAAVVFLNEDMREKVQKKAGKVVKSGEDELTRLRTEVKNLKSELQNQVSRELAKASRKLAR